MVDNHHGNPMAFRRRLGKNDAKFDDRVPQLVDFADKLPKFPATRDWLKPVPHWGDMLNTDLGDCTMAGLGHLLQAVIFNETGKMPSIADTDILKAYEVICGYNPRDPQNTDNGGVLLDVLNYVLKNGFLGHTIDGFAQVDSTKATVVKAGINEFGGVYTGLSLPKFAEDQKDWVLITPHNPADAVPNSWGGHCVYVGAYDADNYYGITWGARIRIARAFFEKYCDECWVHHAPRLG